LCLLLRTFGVFGWNVLQSPEFIRREKG